MNQMIESLQAIMNQSQGETIDCPHPADIKDVRVNALTEWHYSVLKSDSYKDDEGERHHDCVSGRICEIAHMDAYGEPLGEPRLVLQHKYGTPTRQSKDVSVTAIKPQEVRALKARFPGAFAELDLKIAREGRETPLVLLDSIPPEVVQVIYTMGTRTVRQLAEFDETQIETLLSKLHSHKMAARANFVMDYIQRARERVGVAATPARRTKQAA